MKPISLFGAGTLSKSAVATAQRRINCYWEITADGDKSKAVLYGTPGTLLAAALPNTIRGWRVAGSKLYACNGPNVTYLDTALTQAYLANAITNGTGKVGMTANATQLMLVDGIAGYTSTLPTGALTAIADVDFPNGATTCTYVAGYGVVEKPNTSQFWVSALNDFTGWTGTFFQSAFSSPNYLVAVDSDHGILILFGTDYLEYWYASGALDFPFAHIPNADQQWGLAAKWSRYHLDNALVFLAQHPQGQYQVMKIALTDGGYAPRRISNSDLENIIAGLSTPSDAVGCGYMLDGHAFYQLTFQAAQRSFLVDVNAPVPMWYEVQTGVATSGRHIADLSITFNAVSYVSDYASGNIYQVSPSTYTDNGVTIKRLIQSRHIGDGNEMSIDEVFFDMETGVGLQSGQGSDPQIMLEVSKDGGRTFGPQRFINFGKVGQYDAPRAVARRVANGRDIVLRVSMTDPVKFVITREGATVTQGYA